MHVHDGTGNIVFYWIKNRGLDKVYFSLQPSTYHEGLRACHYFPACTTIVCFEAYGLLLVAWCACRGAMKGLAQAQAVASLAYLAWLKGQLHMCFLPLPKYRPFNKIQFRTNRKVTAVFMSSFQRSTRAMSLTRCL
jgi:hypothetical protein